MYYAVALLTSHQCYISIPESLKNFHKLNNSIQQINEILAKIRFGSRANIKASKMIQFENKPPLKET
jgi:hypothetical protein